MSLSDLAAEQGAPGTVQEGLVATSRIQTVVWAWQQFTPAAFPRSQADDDLLSRGMAALSLNPGTVLEEFIEDRHHVSFIGVSSADYVKIPAWPYEFLLHLEAVNEVPVAITVADWDRSVRSPLRLKPPEVLSWDFLGAQVGKARTDEKGRRVTANRRFMDDNTTPVMSILVQVSPDAVELRQKVDDAPAFNQGTFPRRVATPRLEQQVWGSPTTALDTNLRESRPERFPPQDARQAKRPRRALDDDRTSASTIVQAEGAAEERQQPAAQRAVPAQGRRATGRLTAQETETIKARMHEHTPTAIAQHLNRNMTTVRAAIERFQAEAEGERATGPLTAQEEKTIKARMDGDGPTAIARHLNREPQTVQAAIVRFRAEAKGGRATGPLTAQEEKTIKARMDRDGPTAIAKHLNRDESTVRAAIGRLRAEIHGGRATGRLTAQETETIKTRMDEHTPTAIARHLNREVATVRDAIGRLRTEIHGGRASGRLTAQETKTIKASSIATDQKQSRKTSSESRRRCEPRSGV
jgi:DNA-binding CsgD family transcriptional regulator